MSVFDDFEVCACAAWPSFFCACTHFRVLPTICIPQSPTHQAASAHSSCFRRTFILTWCMALVRVVCRPIALPSSLKEWAATTVVRQPRSKSPRSGGIAPTGFCRYRVPSALRSYHGLSVRVCFLEAGPPAQVPDRGAAAWPDHRCVGLEGAYFSGRNQGRFDGMHVLHAVRHHAGSVALRCRRRRRRSSHVGSLRRVRLQEAREVKMRAGVTGRLTEPPVRPQPIVENNAEQTTLGHLLCGLLAP